MKGRLIASLAALLVLPAANAAQGAEIGLAAREALASMVPEGNLIVYGTVVDTVENVSPFFRAGEFSKIIDPPKGSSLRFVHARINVERVLRGRVSGRELNFSMPVDFIAAVDSLHPPGTPIDGFTPPDPAATARTRAALAPGATGIFPLVLEPRAPGGYLLASQDMILPEREGKLAGVPVQDFSIYAREFFGRRELPSMVIAADAIVQAHMGDTRAACESRGDTVFTCLHLSVDRWFKSDTDTALVVLVPDPTATSWRVPLVRHDIPDFQLGGERVFFLEREEGGKWSILEGQSGVFLLDRNWITEWPREGGPVIGLNMDLDGFDTWISHVLMRASEGKSDQ